jgi:hypothetical protein
MTASEEPKTARKPGGISMRNALRLPKGVRQDRRGDPGNGQLPVV